MVYLNNAATSYPKPDCVIKTMNNVINALPSGQFRSGGISSYDDIFDECRKNLSLVLGVKDADRIFFTSGSTEGLNQLIFGLPFKAGEYLITATEHNSVLRPLFNMGDGSGRPVIIPCDRDGYVEPESIAGYIKKDTKALIINHCSNVTGAVQDIKSIGEICRERGIMLILDCSQSAGCMEIRADEWGVSALAFTGHKSLMGVQGTGGFYIKSGMDLKPIIYGGTGRDSSVIEYSAGDYEYEAGTRNAPGIAALNAACGYILDKGIDSIRRSEEELMAYLLERLKKIKTVRIYGEGLKTRGPVISIGIEGIKCADASYILQNAYDVITRAGLQCAPLIHKFIGSGDDGTLRLSMSFFTKKEDLDAAIKGIEDIGYTK